MQNNSVSEVLAAQIVAMRTRALDEAAYRAFSRAATDYATCGLLGAREPVTEKVLRYVNRYESTGRATVFGRTEQFTPAAAAFVSATAAHGLDFDDGHTRAGGHPGASVFPAVFALAEDVGSSSDEIIRAVIAGYHAFVRIAMMMHPRSAQTGWHNTAVSGTFAATAAAASLLRLDADKTMHALGLAGSFTGGLLEFLADGPDVKRIHPAMAARDGIACAGLAAEGITGPRRVFEGRHGIMSAMIKGEGDYSNLHADKLDIADLYFKLYPCCRHYHAAIDGVLDLRAEHAISLDNVRTIRLGLYGVAVRGHDHKEAATLLSAQMSAPIAAGLALVDGAVSVSAFSQESLRRPEVREAISRVEVSVDAECEAAYPKCRSGHVAIELADGRVVERRVLDPKGEGANPLGDDDLKLKFLSNAAPILGKDSADQALMLLWNFQGQPDSLARLRALVTPAA